MCSATDSKLKMFPSYKDYRCQYHGLTRLYYLPVVGGLYRKRVELCLNLLPKGERILEVGFGSGITFQNLNEMYSEIHGIDLDANCADVTACFKARGISTNLINASVMQLPYQDNYFDSVLLISILEHLKPEQQRQAQEEIRRVLKPGGVMVYGVPVERRLMVCAFRLLGYDIRKYHFSTERDVSDVAKEVFSPMKATSIKPLGGCAGTVYEACSYRK